MISRQDIAHFIAAIDDYFATIIDDISLRRWYAYIYLLIFI